MRFRTLGETGIDISEVGLGTWQISSDFGPMPDETARDILQTALDSGIRFLDTADVYGNGRSESVIGAFLEQCEAPVFVATKFGRGGDVFPNHYTKQSMIDSVKASLDRLRRERLDLLQLHCIPPEVLRAGHVFDWMRELKQDGLIRHFGASVETVEEGLVCLEQEGIASLQVIYNVFRQKLTTELLPQAAEKGVGIIVRLPLASGLLSGKFTKETTFAESDHRHFNRNGDVFNVGETFAGLPFEKGVELADRLKSDIPPGMSLAQMAMRWILDHPEVSVVIPGASSEKHVRENAEVSSLPPLDESLHQRLRDFYCSSVRDHIRGGY